MTIKTTRWPPYAVPLCLTVFFLWISSQVMGLSLFDDSGYLQTGSDIHLSSFLYQQYWSPLYCFWFKALTLICPNPISRYFLSWGILVVLLGMVPAWMKTPSAWLYSFIIIVFPFLTIGPFVSLFAAAIVLCSMCLVLQRERSLVDVTAASCLVCFVVSFARPEFDYGVYISALVTLVVLVASQVRAAAAPSGMPRRWIRAMAIGLTVAAMTATMLYVMRHAQSARSGMAFAQHYNVRASEHGLIPNGRDNWKGPYAEQTFGVDLGHTAENTQSKLSDFFHANPRLFLAYVVENLFDPTTLILLLFLVPALLWPWLRNDARRFRPASVFLLLIAVPPMAGVLVIYPDLHYAIIFIPALAIYTLQLFKMPLWVQSPSIPWVLGSAFAMIWLLEIALPLRSNVPPWSLHGDQMALSRVRCVRDLDQFIAYGNPTVFDAAGMQPVYFAQPRRIVSPSALPQWDQFEEWAARTRPAWISTNPDLVAGYHISFGQLNRFLQDDLGYTPHPCPVGADLTVYTNDH